MTGQQKNEPHHEDLSHDIFMIISDCDAHTNTHSCAGRCLSCQFQWRCLSQCVSSESLDVKQPSVASCCLSSRDAPGLGGCFFMCVSRVFLFCFLRVCGRDGKRGHGGFVACRYISFFFSLSGWVKELTCLLLVSRLLKVYTKLWGEYG